MQTFYNNSVLQYHNVSIYISQSFLSVEATSFGIRREPFDEEQQSVGIENQKDPINLDFFGLNKLI